METTRRKLASMKLLLGVQAHLLDAAEAALLAAIQFHAVGLGALQLLGGGHTGLDLHGQIDFLGGGEQGHLADLLEVHAHRVAREHGHAGIGVAFGAVARPGLGARGDLRKGGGLHRGLQLLLGNAVQQILLGVNAGLDLVLGQAVGSRRRSPRSREAPRCPCRRHPGRPSPRRPQPPRPLRFRSQDSSLQHQPRDSPFSRRPRLILGMKMQFWRRDTAEKNTTKRRPLQEKTGQKFTRNNNW